MEKREVRTPTLNCMTPLATILLLVAGLAGCAQPAGVPGTTALSKPLMLGIEPMHDDPPPQLPFTNRFIADLAAMPGVQVVFLGSDRNSSMFSAWSGGKVRVSPWLHAEGNCMTLTYTLFQSGEQQGVFGLVIAPPPTGAEPSSACVDRAAGQLYQALVLQGL
jgi:hypothetical protein